MTDSNPAGPPVQDTQDRAPGAGPLWTRSRALDPRQRLGLLASPLLYLALGCLVGLQALKGLGLGWVPGFPGLRPLAPSEAWVVLLAAAGLLGWGLGQGLRIILAGLPASLALDSPPPLPGEPGLRLVIRRDGMAGKSPLRLYLAAGAGLEFLVIRRRRPALPWELRALPPRGRSLLLAVAPAAGELEDLKAQLSGLVTPGD